LRQLVTNDRSLARSAYERLSRGQKRCLLIASGLEHCSSSWERLDSKEIEQIQLGVRRLANIVNQFINCNEEDFKKATLSVTPQSIEKSNAELQERIALVEQITKGTNHDRRQSNAIA
jgi:DNA-binding MarR family transcriptional regulator